MTVFSKGAARMEVIAAEFLPHEKQLYILIADADKNIHVLQYDPESEFTNTSSTDFRLTKKQIQNHYQAED
jgi:succinylglutamate desuccinylase